MKKAVLITGVIWAVLTFLCALVFMILGLVFISAAPEVAQTLVIEGEELTPEQILALVYGIAGVFVFFAVYFIIGGVFSIVLVVNRANEKIKKGAGIALGIVAFVLGAELPGVFFVIDSAMHR